MFYPTLAISDEFKGVIRNPFAFYFPIQRGFSGSLLTLPFATASYQVEKLHERM